MDNVVKWNSKVRLILADVDETIADVYTPATPEMIKELDNLLLEDIILFLVSGGGLQSIRERITDRIKPELRKKILIAHCSGAEVWGFEDDGKLNSKPYYGLYDEKLTDLQKSKWREIIQRAIQKFNLKIFDTMPVANFKELSGDNPLAVMFVDRGPQITFEFSNSYNLSINQKEKLESEIGITIPDHEGTFDFRVSVMNFLKEEYEKEGLPVTSKLSGIFALDNPIAGIDKTYAIKYVLENAEILAKIGLTAGIENTPEAIEIWGDKFGQKKGGADFQMCKAVSPNVRTINFRHENPEEFVTGYNIVLWNGEKELHEGLLEYLQISKPN